MFYIGNNFIWTKCGLRKVKEVRDEHQILGIDREGHSLWSTLRHPPLLKGKRKSLIHLILDNTEIIVAPTCELCGRRRTLQAADIKEGEKLEVFSDPECIYEALKKPSTDLVQRIYVKGYGDVPLTAKMAYLLGILSQHTVTPYLWSKGVVIVKVPKEGVEYAKQRLKETIDDCRITTVREGPYWGFIGFQSEVARLVSHMPEVDKILTEVLKCPYPVLRNFMQGFIDVRSISFGNKRRIATKMEEIELRKLLYNILFVHSVRCCTSVVKHRLDTQICYIDVLTSDLTMLYKGKIPSKTLSAWARVKGMYNVVGEMYAFPRPETIYWSPVIDLVPLAA